jgi:hypothetical protein
MRILFFFTQKFASYFVFPQPLVRMTHRYLEYFVWRGYFKSATQKFKALALLDTFLRASLLYEEILKQ